MAKFYTKLKANILKDYSLFFVYLLGFLFAFHTALPAYVNSSFLDVFLPENSIGLVYTMASIFTIFLFFLAPSVLKKFGNYHTALFLVGLEILALLGLILGQTPFWLVTFFMVSLITIPFIYLSWDIFLEGFSNDEETGKIRGIYLTLGNLAWVFSPLICGLILVNGDYWKIYLAALVFLIPTFFILIKKLKDFKDSDYQAVSVWQTFQEVGRDKNIRNIFSSNFLLHFFYSWMTIYTPIYLHKYIGFSWTEIGVIFGIMLLPFVFIQFPLGRIADEKLGEKEILSTGFIIMALSTFILFFIPQTGGLWLWALLLLVTRIGASSVEIMNDTYFFKKVNNLNTNIISFFRISRPLAYVLGPLIMTLTMNLFGADHGQPFFVLGLIMLLGLLFSLNLKDTR